MHARHLTYTLLLTWLLAPVASAQKGPPSGYGDSYEAYAIWQPIANAAMARMSGAEIEQPRMKTCVAYRKINRYGRLNVQGQRVFLVELDEANRIVRWLSEAAFPERSYPARRNAAAAPFWCFFSDRSQPPTAVAIAEGRSREEAAPIVYTSGASRLEYIEQPPTADLTQMMIRWTRER
jgi:hypothetical protein